MTIQIESYTRKPFDVQAVQVTAENMAEVAKWCKGRLSKPVENEDGSPTSEYIVVRVHNAATDRHKQAFEGDWIFYSKSTGYKVYGARAFNSSFEKKVVYTEADAKAQLGEALEEERGDTKPEISVAQVLVDEHNKNHRDASSGRFVTEEFAKENPDTTVAEAVLSPEDQARLSS